MEVINVATNAPILHSRKSELDAIVPTLPQDLGHGCTHGGLTRTVGPFEDYETSTFHVGDPVTTLSAAFLRSVRSCFRTPSPRRGDPTKQFTRPSVRPI